MQTLELSEMEQDILFHAIEQSAHIAMTIRKRFGVPAANSLVKKRCQEILAGVHNLDDNPWMLRVILCKAIASNTFLHELEGCGKIDMNQAKVAGVSLARKISIFTGINVKFPGA